MVKHNNVVPNAHYKKDWQVRVKCFFDQATKKKSRRLARAQKAAAVAPRPVDKLRPVVRCPTIRYNRKVRAGRGFSLDELKAAKISPALAKTIGIAVDARRRNRSVEGLQANVARLQAYKERLVLFPRRSNQKPRGGDSGPADTATAVQVNLGAEFPIAQPAIDFTETANLAEARVGSAYKTLRQARATKYLEGFKGEKPQEPRNPKGKAAQKGKGKKKK